MKNGLSLKEVDVGDMKIKLLAWDDNVIPGQCAIDYGKLDKWKKRTVVVHFEVFEDLDPEEEKWIQEMSLLYYKGF